jgi:type I restriction enzyme S subunit
MLEFYFSIATGSLLEKRRVYYSDFVKITKSLPSVEEQREISKLLLLYNQKVSLQTYKVSALEQRKIGFLQQIFSQNTQFKMVDNTNYPKWEIVSLGDCCTHVIQKNKERTDLPVYSVNNLVGFTPQSNQFENREVASEDKKNYSVVSYREFAYNPSRINVGSIAFLKENISVIVSPLYVVFKCSGTLMEEFLSLYVRTNEFKTQRKTNTSGSVRDSLSFDGFKEIKIGLPSIEEQAKIVIFFELLDRQIQIERDKLEAMKLVKMGLLQKMFK